MDNGPGRNAKLPLESCESGRIGVTSNQQQAIHSASEFRLSTWLRSSRLPPNANQVGGIDRPARGAGQLQDHVRAPPLVSRPGVRNAPMVSEELAEWTGQTDGEHGGFAAPHSQHRGVHRWHRPEGFSRDSSPQFEDPPWRPRRRQQGARRCCRPLACHLPLYDQISSLKLAPRIVEQVAHQGRGRTEGQ